MKMADDNGRRARTVIVTTSGRFEIDDSVDESSAWKAETVVAACPVLHLPQTWFITEYVLHTRVANFSTG